MVCRVLDRHWEHCMLGVEQTPRRLLALTQQRVSALKRGLTICDSQTGDGSLRRSAAARWWQAML